MGTFLPNKSCCPNSIVIKENRFQEDSDNFWLQKLTLKTENAQLLPAHHYVCLQDIKISDWLVDFYAQISLILDTRIKNSTTQLMLLNIGDDSHKSSQPKNQCLYYSRNFACQNQAEYTVNSYVDYISFLQNSERGFRYR